jgi:hypothetical protein
VEPTICLSDLYESDAVQNGGDDNGVIDRDEYVTFVKLQGPTGFLDGIDFYVELPAALQLAFTSLACLCTNPDYGGNTTNVGCTGSARFGSVNPMDSDEDALILCHL